MSRRSRRREAAADETATVEGLTREGAGVIRAGKAVFVGGALPGERVRFRRRRSHRRHDEGELLEILQAAPERVAPRCAHFGVCGGCALQHLAPEAQIEAKQAELLEHLQRLGHVVPQQWLPPLRGPVWGYRRRARLGCKYVLKKERVLVGFRERLAPYIADVHRCEVLADPVGGLIAPLAELLSELSIRQRLPQIEVAVADNAVALVLRVLEAPSCEDLRRLQSFSATHRVRFYLQPGGLDSVQELIDPLHGPGEPLCYHLPAFDLRLEFAPTDFLQINAAVNEALVSRAVDLLEIAAGSVVLDLYCGLGNFTLPLARRAARVIGVEGDAQLVQRARRNAQLNGLTNIELHAADLSQAGPPEPPWLRAPCTHVLLDPPRAGASAMLGPIARLRPQCVLYISCHPGSLARDVGQLVHEHGMILRAAGVLDMFPHTTHVESLALLSPGAHRGSRA
ncbi:MAG TPA: 23S rRNA (uracil(1939)-C(5))-methyltransferase RlmD [Steroidobacteraceae bacterium]